ncbi:tripartite tricarboxylate transporter TctB family protein [Lutibaculum baratangense]|uniref:DUF1468 domain-containing protein n=1 Tax=Lutibaculum baratangense AMV1 TaxID=631454 RepID=V4RHP8_9HYPH|nr:tripartite tricarboxylate transporter TctB family protein [Lutibaculum baratangense]ESR25651.1 hypothetical protein N177_1484 [Lutibaculum baratangense AMV1]
MNPADHQQTEGGAERRPAPLSVHRTDLVLALVLLGICAILWWDTTTFPEIPASLAQNAPPTVFPRLMLGAIIIMALFLPFEHRMKPDGGEDIDRGREEAPRPIVFLTGAVIIAVVFLTQWIGSLMAMVLVTAVIPWLWGERRYAAMALFAIGLPIAVWFVFTVLLEVNLVAGIPGQFFE